MRSATFIARWAPVLIGMTVFTVLGAQPPARIGVLSAIWDKAVHGVGYGVLGVMALRALAGTVRGASARHVALAALLSLGHGGGLEIMQAAIPWRDGSWGDFAADGVGFALAMLAVRWWIGVSGNGVEAAEEGS